MPLSRREVWHALCLALFLLLPLPLSVSALVLCSSLFVSIFTYPPSTHTHTHERTHALIPARPPALSEVPEPTVRRRQCVPRFAANNTLLLPPVTSTLQDGPHALPLAAAGTPPGRRGSLRRGQDGLPERGMRPAENDCVQSACGDGVGQRRVPEAVSRMATPSAVVQSRG